MGNVNKLYNNIIKDFSEKEIGNEKQFETAMKSENNVKKLYDALVKKGYKESQIGNYDTFSSLILPKNPPITGEETKINQNPQDTISVDQVSLPEKNAQMPRQQLIPQADLVQQAKENIPTPTADNNYTIVGKPRQTEYPKEQPSWWESFYKGLGAGIGRVGGALIDIANIASSNRIISPNTFIDPYTGMQLGRTDVENTIVTPSYEEKLNDKIVITNPDGTKKEVYRDPGMRLAKEVDEWANEMSMEARPYYGEKDFLDLLKSGEIGKALQLGLAVTTESAIPMLVGSNPIGRIFLGTTTSADHYAMLREEMPDMPEWKRVSSSIGAGVFEQFFESKGVNPVKWFGKKGYKQGMDEAEEWAARMLMSRWKKLGLFGKNFAKDVATEGLEEVATSASNDALNSVLDLIDRDSMGNGIEQQYEDAKRANPNLTIEQFALEKARSYLNDFIGGSLAGAYMGTTARGLGEGYSRIAGQEQRQQNEYVKRAINEQAQSTGQDAYEIAKGVYFGTPESKAVIDRANEMNIEDAITAEVDAISNNGNIISVSDGYGNEGVVVKGNVALTYTDYGKALIDRDNSDEQVYIRNNEGKIIPMAIKDAILQSQYDAEEYKQFQIAREKARYYSQETFNVGDNVYLTSNGEIIRDEAGNPLTSQVTSVGEDGSVNVEVEDVQGNVQEMTMQPEEALESLSPAAYSDGENIYIPKGNRIINNETGEIVQEFETKEEADAFIQGKTDVGEWNAFDIMSENQSENDGAPASEQNVLQENQTEEQQNVIQAEQQIPSYPLTEDGEPDFSQMTSEQSIQVLDELGDQETIDAFIANNLSDAQKSYTKAEKMKPKSTSFQAIKAEQQQIMADREAAKAKLDLWSSIKSANDLRKLQRTSETLSDARLAEQRQARIEQEKAEKTAEFTGKTTFKESPKIEGNSYTRTLPDGTKIRGKYTIVPAESLIPSHDPNNNWETTEGFPTVDGVNVNDRDYKNDAQARQVTEQMAANYGGQAIENVPVVSSDGVVYDGNGRTIAGQIAAQNGTDAEYIQQLTDNAANYGFTPEQIASVNNPRLVLVLDEDLPYNTETFAKFNAQEKKTQSTTEKSVAAGKRMTESVVNQISDVLDSYSSIESLFGSEKATADLLKVLQDNGIIQPTEIAGLTENGLFSAAGREYITSLVLGSIFSEDAVRRMGNNLSLKNGILRAVPAILENRKLGEYSLIDEINEAITLLYEARANNMALPLYLRQTNAFEETPKDKFSEFSQLLASQLDAGVAKFRELLDIYNNSAKDHIGGQQAIFGEITKEDVKQSIIELYGKRGQNQETGSSETETVNPLQIVQGSEQTEQQSEAAEIKEDVSVDIPIVQYVMQQQNKLSEQVAENISQAESEVNTNPTEAQKKAGNYKKGHVKIDGYDITIEQPKGSTRSGVDENGNKWETKMNNTYGYIRGTQSVDGDHIDVFLSDNPTEGNVYVVDQINQETGEFDEHKVMYGFNSMEEAREAYLSNYSEGWKIGTITEVRKDEFKKWIDSSKRKTKPFSEYSSVNKTAGQNEADVQKSISTSIESTMTDSQKLAFDAISEMLDKAGIPVETLTDEQMNQLANEASLMTVYHGSGAEFDAFDHSHMGEGEGAQAYGWGSYVTEVEEIGRTYAESTSGNIFRSGFGDFYLREIRNGLAEGKQFDEVKEKLLAHHAGMYEKAGGNTDMYGDFISDYETLQQLKESDLPKRNLYTVEIPDNDGKNYLDWEKEVDRDMSKRLSEQLFNDILINDKKGSYQDDVEKEMLQRDIEDSFESVRTGKDLYKAISLYIGEEAASEFLSRAGFVGISYPAQYTTGGRSDNARNYVIFNEEDLQIKDKISFMKGKKKASETVLPEDESSFKGTVVSDADGTKVLNNLDNVAKEYDKFSKNRPWTFLGDVAKALSARQHGSKSQYATFETVNGQVVTIRLSDHNASTRNFDNAGRENGISIVISRKPNQGITNDGNARLVEFFYPDKALQKAEGKPLAEIVRSIKQALYSGEYTDTTGLAEIQEVNADQQEVRGGVVYGATVGGKIYMNGSALNPETPIHEYTHIWDNACRKNNPELWNRGVELMKQTPVWEEVKNDPNYSDLNTDDEIASEVHSRLTGRDGSRILEDMAEQVKREGTTSEISKTNALISKLKKWLSDFWYWVKDTMTPWTKEEASRVSLEDFINMPLKDLAQGRRLDETRFRLPDNFGETATVPINYEYGEGYYADGVSGYFVSEEALLDAFRNKYPAYVITMSEDGESLEFERFNPTNKTRGFRRYANVEYNRMRRTAENLAQELGLDVEIIEDVESLEGKKRYAKGWYDVKTKKIYIVFPNATGSRDVARTILHEGVAHYNLREMLGENFDLFLDNIYSAANKTIKSRIDGIAEKQGISRRIATEEYLAMVAEDVTPNDYNAGWFSKVKASFLKLLEKLGINLQGYLTDNDFKYIVWRSYDNLKNKAQMTTSEIAKNKQTEQRLLKQTSTEQFAAEHSSEYNNSEESRIIEESKANGTYMKAPNGRPTNLTERQWAQVRTKAFKDWFGDWENDPENASKVVDENGEPRVMYHGTREQFNVFDKNLYGRNYGGWSAINKGIHLTSKENSALLWAIKSTANGEISIMPLFVNIRNPLSETIANGYENGTLEQLGYDGYFSSEFNYPNFDAIAIEPSQVKSATDNKGDFDQNNPDIRFRIGEEAPKTRADIVTESLIKAGARKDAATSVRLHAMKAIGKSLRDINKAIREQAKYSDENVGTLRGIVNDLMRIGELSSLDSQDIRYIFSKANQAVTKSDLTEIANGIVDRLMDATNSRILSIMNKKLAEAKTKKNEKVAKASKMSGYQQITLSKLDELMKGLPTMDDAKKQYGKVKERYEDSIDENLRMELDAELEAYEMYFSYLETISPIMDNIKSLNEERDELLQAKKGKRGNEAKSYRETINEIDKAIVENKADLADALTTFVNEIDRIGKEGRENKNDFSKKKKARKELIRKLANFDLSDIPAYTQEQVNSELKKMRYWQNSGFANFLFSPLNSLNMYLKLFGRKHAGGKGYLFNYFEPRQRQAMTNKYVGMKQATEELDKASIQFTGMDFNKLSERLHKKSDILITYMDGGKNIERYLTHGQALYLYMINKMSDGAMKLRKTGISEEDIENIASNMDSNVLDFADWIQNDFLPKKRAKYNKVHMDMFGVPMARIENYFPIRIAKGSVYSKKNINKDTDTDMPSTITGAIIKRTANTNPIDLTTDALSALYQNIDEMEDWAAYAQLREDFNTLIEYNTFKKRLNNMKSVHGSGDVLYRNFVNAVRTAVNKDTSVNSKTDRFWKNISRGTTVASLNFNLNPAIKQILGYPAIFGEADLIDIIKNTIHPYKSFKWAMENLPLFEERVSGGNAGWVQLELDKESSWEVWNKKYVEWATKIGMAPNRFMDAIVCAATAKAAYDTSLRRHKKWGFKNPEEKALADAERAYNETQPSSQGLYISPMQRSNELANIIYSLFRNANFAFYRRLVEAVRNLSRVSSKDRYNKILSSTAHRLMQEEGFTEEHAKKVAREMTNRQIAKDSISLVIFGYVLNTLWSLGSNWAYLLAGDDDDEKKKMIKDALIVGLLSPITGIPLFGSFAEDWMWSILRGSYYDSTLLSTPLTDEIERTVSNSYKLAKSISKDDDRRTLFIAVEFAKSLVNLCVKTGIGINPDLLTNMVYGVINAANSDFDSVSDFRDLLFTIINVPAESREKLIIDELGITEEGLNERLSQGEIEEIFNKFVDRRIERQKGIIAPFAKEDYQTRKTAGKEFKKQVRERVELKQEDNGKD